MKTNLFSRLAVSIALFCTLFCAACVAEHSEESRSLVQVGELAPDFTLPLFDGSSVTLSAQRGKVVLLTFFASWCPDCQAELSVVQHDVIDRFADADFSFLPVSRGETREAIAAFRAESGCQFPMALDADASVYHRYATLTVPRNYLIDRSGRVVALSADYQPAEFEALINRIESLLAE